MTNYLISKLQLTFFRSHFGHCGVYKIYNPDILQMQQLKVLAVSSSKTVGLWTFFSPEVLFGMCLNRFWRHHGWKLFYSIIWCQQADLWVGFVIEALMTKLGDNSILSFMLYWRMYSMCFVLNIFLFVNMIEKVIFLTQTNGAPHNKRRIRLPVAQDLSLDI